ncbi:MAG TPA: class I SAM-dependent methyltransferase, partial [Bacteroidia bacterium]|nr:class I SAM-dependent methyltransferase [Bacteroidia bacterium]
KTLMKYITEKDHVADFGCGVGGFLPTLSSLGKTVTGIDFSAKCIDIAKKHLKKFPNIRLVVHDMTKPLRLKCDVAVAANFLLSRDAALLEKMLKNMLAPVKKGGHAIIVTPALESMLLVYRKIAELRRKHGESHTRARSYVEKQMKKDIVSLADGVLLVGGVPTKHYLGEEMEAQLQKHGFGLVERYKIEYSWDTELDNISRNEKGPYPWDWLFVGKKK